MILENIISIFILNYLRKNRDLTADFAKWEKLLRIGIGIGVALIFLEVTHLLPGFLLTVLTIALFVALSYLVYRVPGFSKGKSFVYAVLPYFIITSAGQLIQNLAPDFFGKIDTYFETAEFFAFIWAISVWWTGRKQKKALDAERLKALEKEKEFQMSQALKAQLEIQVAERTAALTRQKEELETTLSELKAAQSQLIQAEKMASLGELTAGIAHEIQNPLNFVNNFSEVSNELIEEIEEERSKKQEARDEELIDEILKDIKENLGKIAHHGKRADGIVKGMLQHSRTGSGQKELTDVNELADEFLRLSYHGLRAKDKSFNADFKMDFDASLPKVNIVSQDIGRVLLNLINNAFYACGNSEYRIKNPELKPTVTVSTKKLGKKIQITVSDNGPGIPEDIKEKIFQPFFTTKPTGQGTGLGLSLSYDIVKAHGGELNVESAAGRGTHFVITLPTGH
ncbi:sensor histidine kinase [Aquiflexum gelatinilyticum]|uniref:histidine kinase n=1 Tax=Aquiflexum gelatinilyticum TaxID=2961943 RepID=A0A9X2P8J2_9BACT|nr:ATP-binding protein [Aquiflexum gelatinilyticum]MCR9015387.1 ATP-binding protein [Aquiflexum gelatinilyticum]